MNTYEISYTEFPKDADGRITGKAKRIVVGTIKAKNGIAAITELLQARVENFDPDDLRTLGSNKRGTMFGITFEANKKEADDGSVRDLSGRSRQRTEGEAT